MNRVRVDVAIIGGGPAGLIAAETVVASGASCAVFDKMPSVGRKFALAGRGGLNLTHSEAMDDLMGRYGASAGRLAPAVSAFDPQQLRNWAAALGQPTFVGTSGRVFPDDFRANALLRSWTERLVRDGVQILTGHRWDGWNVDGSLRITGPDEVDVRVAAQATILSLGGASWPSVGGDGSWVSTLEAAGVAVAPLRPANCGFRCEWTTVFRERFAGTPVKDLAVAVHGVERRGEAMVTETGIEGGVIYAVAAVLRDTIEREGPTELHLDLRPDVSTADLVERLERRRAKESTSRWLRRAGGLSPVASSLLREITDNDLPVDPAEMATLIKDAPLVISGPESIARAISTAGGVEFDEIDAGYMLRNRPGTFVAGEMLDWEAPTGGYLLQGCFSTGVAAAEGALRWLRQGRELSAVQ